MLMMTQLKTEEYLIETADRCNGMAREGRELVSRLEALSNELMAKAVELDTARQKNERARGNGDKVATN
jgi:outer membrane murein-binding lipoprotein Lpp